MHPRPHAGRYSRLRGPRRERDRPSLIPLYTRPGFLPTLDGRRDQPGEPAHPIGAPAGYAGRTCLDCRPISPVASSVSRLGDPEPARAGGDLSLAGSPARSFSSADRCRLPRPRGRAADAHRHNRDYRESSAAGDECRRASGSATPGAAYPRRRERRRGNSLAGTLRQAARNCPRWGATLCFMGPGTTCQSSPDARLSCASSDRWPVQPVDRRRAGAGAAGVAAPNGSKLCWARGGCHGGSRHRTDLGAVPLSPTQLRSGAGFLLRRVAAPGALRDRAEQTAAVLPPLLVVAERVAVTVAQGVHGRRRVGQGETFWQFRQYEPGDAATRIDWRESAKSQRLYVRETEWEAAQSVWLWRDASASMGYTSAGYLPGAAWPTKLDRAELLLLALASLLVRGGERLTLLGTGMGPMSGRIALSRVAEMIGREGPEGESLPDFEPLPRFAQLVFIGDFLSPLEAISTAMARFAGAGLKGHLLQVVDPAEEDLPFDGRVRFEGVEERDQVVIGRVESIRGDYAARFKRHRDGLAAIASALGWSFGFHRTDHPPHLALLALHAALSPDRRR